MIKNITFKQVTAAEILAEFGYPYFGYSRIDDKSALVNNKLETVRTAAVWVRKDLPTRVYISVLAHETYHAADPYFLNSSVLSRELRANWAGFRADWRGFFQGIWMSLTDRDRMALYWKRITENF